MEIRKKHPILGVWYAPMEKVSGVDFFSNFFTRPYILREVYKNQHTYFSLMCTGPVTYVVLLNQVGLVSICAKFKLSSRSRSGQAN